MKEEVDFEEELFDQIDVGGYDAACLIRFHLHIQSCYLGFAYG